MHKNFGLAVVSLLACFFIAEFVTRALFSTATLQDRLLLWSRPPFIQHENESITYHPDTRIREIIVYADEIEYDIEYKTNNLGFVDTVDYPLATSESDTRRIAFVGDSFTVGMGAPPWVPLLRSALRENSDPTIIYNLGLTGASVQHYAKSLRYAEQFLNFNEVAVLAISDDFFRTDWFPLAKNDGMRICPRGERKSVCAQRIPFASFISHNATAAEVLRFASATRHAHRAHEEKLILERSGTIISLLMRSRIVSLFHKLINNRPVFAVGEKKQDVSAGLLYFIRRDNIDALTTLARDFSEKKLYLIHLPEKEEVANNAYRLELKEIARALGFHYYPALHTCSWSSKMFHRYDNHPNANGYQNIAACVREKLFSPAMSSTS